MKMPNYTFRGVQADEFVGALFIVNLRGEGEINYRWTRVLVGYSSDFPPKIKVLEESINDGTKT